MAPGCAKRFGGASEELRQFLQASRQIFLVRCAGPTHRKRRPCKRLLRGFQRYAHRFRRPGRGPRA
eukprot:8251179-Pyramimonas_sp.AAC.1